MTVQSSQADDGPIQLMCGLSPYLGVELDPEQDNNPLNGMGDALEIEEIFNNFAWLQIKLKCPHIYGERKVVV